MDYSALSSASPALLPPSSAGSFASRELDTSPWGVGTTRLHHPLELRSSVATSASTASHRAFVTIAIRPSHRVRQAIAKGDLPDMLSDLFLSPGLDF
jgi:hypothetical protein